MQFYIQKKNDRMKVMEHKLNFIYNHCLRF